MKLVLFDIDGTLLWTDGAGRRAIYRALEDVFGATGPTDYWFDGKTDPQIVRELMREAGVADDEIAARLPAVLARYVELLQAELDAPGHEPHVYPGVRELLDALARRDDVVLGLLTGNVVDGARAKLARVGIDFAQFRVGAFGSDHEVRPELPAIAQRRARESLALDVVGDRVFVIGDTPADVTCGLAIGARAIGVATGRYSVEQLAAHTPYAVFPDLADTSAVLGAILAD